MLNIGIFSILCTYTHKAVTTSRQCFFLKKMISQDYDVTGSGTYNHTRRIKTEEKAKVVAAVERID